jgi:hypothetical protein
LDLPKFELDNETVIFKEGEWEKIVSCSAASNGDTTYPFDNDFDGE